MNPSSRTGLRLQLMREQSLIDQRKNAIGAGDSKESFGSLSPSSSADATTASSSPLAMRLSGANAVIVGSSGGGNVKTSPIIISQPIRFTGNRLVHLPPQIIHVQQQQQGSGEDGMGRRNVILSSSLPPGLPQNTPPKAALYARTQRVATPHHRQHKQSVSKQSPLELSPSGGGPCESPRSASFTSAQSELDDIIIDEILSMEEEHERHLDTNGTNKMPSCVSYGNNLEGFLLGSYSRQASSSAPTSMIDIEGLVRDELSQEQDLMRDRRKKDIHNMIERRRRYNINDRIKELGTLLPKGCAEEMKLNKGTILRASVEYIRALKRDQDRLHQLLQRYQNTEQDNKHLTVRIRDLEDHLSRHGLPVPAEAGAQPVAFARPIKMEPVDDSQSMPPPPAPSAGQEQQGGMDYDPAMVGGHTYALTDAQLTSFYSASSMADILETPPVVSNNIGLFGDQRQPASDRYPQGADEPKRHQHLSDLMMALGGDGSASTVAGAALVSSADPLMSDCHLINSQVASPEVQWEAQSFSPEGEQMDFTAQ